MRKLLFLCVPVYLMLAGPVAADEPAAIIDKAIKAHGGAEKLAKHKDAGIQSKAKGTLHLMGGIPFTLETSVQSPNKLRTVMQLEVGGKNITTIQVFDGEKFFINVNGKNLDNLVDDKAIAEVKEQLYQERLVGLAFLKDQNIELAPLGEVKVEGQAAVGVRVSSKGHRDVNLYFDKTTGLLAKIESRKIDIMTQQEQLQEKILSDYKEVDGLMRPSKVVILHDGKPFMDVEISEVKVVDKFDDSVFAKP